MTAVHAGLMQAIIDNPADPVLKLVLADFTDEAGDHTLAHAYRWCAENGKWPLPSGVVHGDWLWWPDRGYTLPKLRNSVLPLWLHKRIKQDTWGQIRRQSFAEAMQAVADHLEPVEA